MRPIRACLVGWTRRKWILALSGALSAQTPERGRLLEPDWGRYLDPATEFEVLRLTSADYDSWLPPLPARAVNRRSSEILVASARTGSPQLYRLELGSGRWRLLTNAQKLDPASPTLSADDRAAYYIDDNRLMSVSLSASREQELFAAGTGERLRGPVAPAADGTSLFLVRETSGGQEILRVRLPRGTPEVVFTEPGQILFPSPNPRRATVLWLNPAGECWLAAFDGSGRRRLESPPGEVLQAFWSPDGRELLYLLDPVQKGEQIQIRTHEIDSRSDRLVAKTSQFVRFAPNSNASVFIGASRSLAAPNILLMLRATRRELTLCEHKAALPEMTSPRFTTDSQRILFESDRHGRHAIYLVNVEKLVEKTDS